MDLRKLKTLIDLVSESNISELEITEAEGKVRIVKAALAGPLMAAPPLAPPVVATAASLAAASAAAAVAAEAAAEAEGKIIKSPMVGTFYRSCSDSDCEGASPREGTQPGCLGDRIVADTAAREI